MLGYFLITFCVYVVGDFFAVRATYRDATAAFIQAVQDQTRLIPVLGRIPGYIRYPYAGLLVVRLLLLDVVLPIGLGTLAIHALYTHKVPIHVAEFDAVRPGIESSVDGAASSPSTTHASELRKP